MNPLPPDGQDDEDDDLSSNPAENLRLQNELLKLKMQAELGAEFGGDMSELPPEIEQQVLQQVLRFHQAQEAGEMRTVGQQMGQEVWPAAHTFSSAAALEAAWEELQKRLTDARIHVSFLADYPLPVKWDFVTQELMSKETISLGALAELGSLPNDGDARDAAEEGDIEDAYDDEAEEDYGDAPDASSEEDGDWERAGLPPGLSGGFVGFIYEEFHPNHAYDIERQVQTTLQDFFQNDFGEWSSHLSSQLVTDTGQRLSQKEFGEKVARFHDLFAGIKDWSFDPFETTWETAEDERGTVTGNGSVEGGVHYTIITDDGAESEVAGPFKAYAELRDGWWSVFFFHLHGFSWA